MAEQKLSPNSDYGRMTAERDALCQELESYRTWHAAALRMVGSDKDEFDSKPLVQYIQELKDRLSAAEQAARAAGEERDALGVVVSAMRGYWSMCRANSSRDDRERGLIETFIRGLDRIGQHLLSPKADAQDQQIGTQLDEQLGPGWRQEQQMAIAERMKSPPSPVAGGPGGAERSGE